MIRKHLLLLIIVSTSYKVFSQIGSSDSALIKKFTLSNNLTTGDSKNTLIEIGKSASEIFRNKILVNAIRKLSENIFIIEKEKIQAIASKEQFFKQYILSNDYWKLSP